MKVVLFCGGFGMRMREFSESIPKPMVMVGSRPILWHIMRYYAHFGHKDFILCLGWQANVIKEYFLNYNECMSNDFVLSDGGRSVDLLKSDIDDWKITFVDTGTLSSIGQRLRAVRSHLEGEDVFFANYTDGLSDVPLPTLIDNLHEHDAAAAFLSAKPTQSFHAVQVDDDGMVQKFTPIEKTRIWMNAGYFVLRNEIFDYMHEGEELVCEPFDRLIEQRRLATLRYHGFWSCMDTFKEKQSLDDRAARGDTPWEVWKTPVADAARSDVPVAPIGAVDLAVSSAVSTT